METSAVNGKPAVCGNSLVHGAASVLLAVVPVFVVTRANTDFGLAEGTTVFLADTPIVGGLAILVHGKTSLADQIAGRERFVFSLVLFERDKGFAGMAVDSVLHSAEAVRFFLALHRAGLPVVLRGAELMKERLRGTEKVGVVPCGIVPLHCRSLFPNERVADFVQLPDVDAEKMAALCTWQPLTPAELT